MHELDEFGDHDEESCYECLLKQEVKGECRCAECCRRLIIEVLPRDAEREPKIKTLGSPILSPPDASGKRELEVYLLNREGGGGCVFLDNATSLCKIYETRPLICRLFSCDGEDRERLVELGILDR